METWGFRFRFLLSRGRGIYHDSENIKIKLGQTGHNITLQSPKRVALKDSNQLIFNAQGFSSKDEAVSFGNRIKVSTLMCGVAFRMGFNVGEDKASSIFGKPYKEKARELGFRIIDDVHGLCVYPDDLPMRVVKGESSSKLYVSPLRFISIFKKIYEKMPNLSDKQTLALELYNLSFFESSERARFLTLISIIECLSFPEKCSDALLNHLEYLVKISKNADLNSYDKNYLLGSLRNFEK